MVKPLHTRWSGEDWLSPSGAGQLVEFVREYWRSRGHDVRVWVESPKFKSRDAFVAVRSDMIDGLPRTHPKNRGKV
jgi:hypothetical protein